LSQCTLSDSLFLYFSLSLSSSLFHLFFLQSTVYTREFGNIRYESVRLYAISPGSKADDFVLFALQFLSFFSFLSLPFFSFAHEKPRTPVPRKAKAEEKQNAFSLSLSLPNVSWLVLYTFYSNASEIDLF
jgi:hypothetical protein